MARGLRGPPRPRSSKGRDAQLYDTRGDATSSCRLRPQQVYERCLCSPLLCAVSSAFNGRVCRILRSNEPAVAMAYLGPEDTVDCRGVRLSAPA